MHWGYINRKGHVEMTPTNSNMQIYLHLRHLNMKPSRAFRKAFMSKHANMSSHIS